METSSKVFTYHLFTKPEEKCSNCDRLTVAAKLENDNIIYGIAVCTAEDQFERAKGIQLADQRMQEGMRTVPIKGFKGDNIEILSSFCKSLGDSFIKKPRKYKKLISEYNHNN